MVVAKYNPPRNSEATHQNDPLEISLVYNVRACGTCSFFWPETPADQPYGPFPAFDFLENTEKGNAIPERTDDYEWMKVQTREEAFPNPEIMDGCRKAPIMTIGINPNLTAFSPGKMGTSWAYPNFTSDNDTDAWTKYAYYYRYRSVYQEHFDFETIKEFLLPEGQIVAEKGGYIISADRTSSSPDFDLVVQYDGYDGTTTIPLSRKLGEPRSVLLFDRNEPENKFKKGDVIAAHLNVPADKELMLWQKQIGYYEQFVPSLENFTSFLKSKGHSNANLKIGEDVCQLDMVACASPHWKPDYLGGSWDSEKSIISNCVSKHSWAIKQLIQTSPAVLYLVGESSYSMFNDAFGHLIHRNEKLPTHPEDYAFTLFKMTCDSSDPTVFSYITVIDGVPFSIKTRLIVTPHFSYDSNFVPQFRLSPGDWSKLQSNDPKCAKFLTTDKRISADIPAKGFASFAINNPDDIKDILHTIETEYKSSAAFLMGNFCDAHPMMAQVLEDLYQDKSIAWQKGHNDDSGYLKRTDGACQFCVNKHWEFPLGCPYDKTKITQPPIGFLAKVAEEIVQACKKEKKS